MRKRTVELVRTSRNPVDGNTLLEQLKHIGTKALGKTFHRWGWVFNVKVRSQTEPNGSERYTGSVVFGKNQERERDNSDDVFAKQFAQILPKCVSFARQMGWTLAEEQDCADVLAVAAPPQRTSVPVPEDIAPHFAHIFDRDPQIRIIWAAIQSAVASGFNKRSHALLYGRPACGKSEILLAFERLLGPGYCCRLDAVSTTKAGAENLLLELDPIPPVIILEEAEKCNPLNLPWLLGVMDGRGEIIKTNARVGSVRKEAKCLILATVNDLQLFTSIMSGALASRFQHKLYCPRPTREVLRKILEREIRDNGGRMEWIDPALDYALETEKCNDPRRIVALLDGKDKLLTGEYQADLEAIRRAMEADGEGLR